MRKGLVCACVLLMGILFSHEAFGMDFGSIAGKMAEAVKAPEGAGGVDLRIKVLGCCGYKCRRKCRNTGTSLGEAQLQGTQAYLIEYFKWFEASVVAALKQKHAGISTTDEGVAREQEKSRETSFASKIKMKNQMRNINRLLLSHLDCCPDPAGYVLAKASELLQETGAMMAAEDRNIGMGLERNESDWARQYGNIVGDIVIFPPSGTFSEREFGNFNSLRLHLFPEVKNRRPENISSGRDADRYLLNEQKAANLREIISAPWREWALQHAPTIEADRIIAWMGAWLSRPTYSQKKVEGVYNMPSQGMEAGVWPRPGEMVGVANPVRADRIRNGRHGAVVQEVAKANGWDPDVMLALVDTESSGNALARDGGTSIYIGLCQVGPMVVDQVHGFGGTKYTSANCNYSQSDPRWDPRTNVDLACKYLNWLGRQSYIAKQKEKLMWTLAAYNWGPGHIQCLARYGHGMIKVGGKLRCFPDRGSEVPKETNNYTMKILGKPFKSVLEGRTDIPASDQLPPPGQNPEVPTEPIKPGPHILTQAEYDRMFEITPALAPGDMISRTTMFRLIGERYVSQAYSDKIDSYGLDQVAKESLRLKGYRMLIMSDILRFLRLNQILKSLAGMGVYEQAVARTSSILQR